MKTRTFTLFVAFLNITMLSKAQFLEPTGGWDYIYNGDVADTTEEAALDGTYEASTSSFEWDGTAPESATGAPGGAGIVSEFGETFLRIQDTGDPRTLEMENEENGRSNRKVGFIHCFSHGGLDSTAAVLDDGITFAFRIRIPTQGVDDLYDDEQVPYPTEGDGYEIDNHGYGFIKISQNVGGTEKTIGFSLMTEFDDDTISTTGAGLYMNLLNGSEPVKQVGVPQNMADTTTLNKINLDPTQWHDFWVQISPGGTGTHQVKIWMDGDVSSPQTFDVTAGANSFRDWSFFWMAFKNTGESGAADVDYIAYKSGLVDPTAAGVNNPVISKNNSLKAYPNPSSAQTSVEYKVEQPGLTTLKVYNALGQVVTTLVNEEMPAGTHTKVWSANGLSEGLYLLELKSGNQRTIDRIILK